MRLYLIRHGQADTRTDGSEAELTAAGREAIERQAESFAALLEHDAVNLQQVWHSGKKRAAQTAAIITTRIAPTIEIQTHSSLKPNADPQILISELEKLRQPILLVSHLPLIPSLIEQLLGNAEHTKFSEFSPGTLIALERQDTDWNITAIKAP